MVVDFPLDTVADTGESQTFTCTATGIPLPSITWSKDDSPLGPGVNITETTNGTESVTSVLFLSNPLLSDAGRYSCNASQDVSGIDIREFNFTLESET